MNAQIWNRRKHCLPLFALLFLASSSLPARSASIFTDVYSTGFEASEGYNLSLDLIGQSGWTGFGSGGNGLVTNFFPGLGQQAYIGYVPPASTNDDVLSVWRPINIDPIPTNMLTVRFSVFMEIVDSSNENYDDFYWSVYNAQTNRLFTLDFDNYYTEIYYALDGTNQFVPTGKAFTNNVRQALVITMNFGQNRWSATLDGAVLVTNQPITTAGAPLNLGDIDAEWVIYSGAAPGDNYLLFDNYQIIAEVVCPPPPQLALLGRFSDGQTVLRVTGQNDARFAIEATTDLLNWSALKTNVITAGYFDYVDAGAVGLPQRLYRARWVP
jgi:hypothetical protein